MTAASLAASLDRILQVQPHLSAPNAVVMAIVGIAVAVVPGLWHVARPFTAMAHEAAHATLASAIGRTVDRMEFTFSGDGETFHHGKDNSSLVRFPVTFVGYLGPSAFGVGAAELIRAGYSIAVLWIVLLGLVVLMVLARKSVGVITVIVAFGVLLLVVGSATVGSQVLTAYGIAWFLLVSGVRIITKHWKGAGDAGTLRELTGLPRGLWPILWLAGAVAALIFGTTLLV